MHQHTRNGVTYAPVWQTWNVVRVLHTSQPVTTSTSSVDECPKARAPRNSADEVASSVPSLRERMQIARIERRMTIDDLAQTLRCDADTLAGFERGDEVLTEALQRTIRRILDLS